MRSLRFAFVNSLLDTAICLSQRFCLFVSIPSLPPLLCLSLFNFFYLYFSPSPLRLLPLPLSLFSLLFLPFSSLSVFPFAFFYSFPFLLSSLPFFYSCLCVLLGPIEGLTGCLRLGLLGPLIHHPSDGAWAGTVELWTDLLCRLSSPVLCAALTTSLSLSTVFLHAKALLWYRNWKKPWCLRLISSDLYLSCRQLRPNVRNFVLWSKICTEQNDGYPSHSLLHSFFNRRWSKLSTRNKSKSFNIFFPIDRCTDASVWINNEHGDEW